MYDTLEEIGVQFKVVEKYDSELRKYNEELLEHLPVALFTLVYKYVLMSYFNIRNTGNPNKSAEVGEADFTVGAMFLNHYANNRKYGKVNVARYLTRYSTSQLIWLAAACDGESEEDPSMHAVGEQVKQLKPSEMHPRVHLVVKH